MPSELNNLPGRIKLRYQKRKLEVALTFESCAVRRKLREILQVQFELR